MKFQSTKLLGVLVLLIVSLGWSAAFAQEREQEQAQLSPNVGRDLLAAFELMEEEKNREALTKLNQLMAERGANMTRFDRASVLQIRGSVHANLENLDESLNDFAEALELNALPAPQNSRLRFNLAQLYFVTERYEESIQFFNRWLQEDDAEATENTYFMLAAAHYHLDQFREALDPIDRAIDLSKQDEPNRRYFDLKNVLLNELNRVPDRTELMKEMVTYWPDELSYWRQLSSLYMDQDQQMEAFGALESAYLGGVIESEDDITMLAQFYSTFNNPHRGAKLIESELERGRVERNVKNLQLLSQLYSQAREHRKAIPVLREAAQISDTGELFFRLGQSLLADERNELAEQAFENAIEKGGLDQATLAEAWVLLGTARFNQAGPGDREQRQLADQALAQAERFPATRNQAREWRTYIRAINDTETRQAMLERDQAERLAVAAQDRFLQSCRAMQIAGRTLSEECREVLGAEGEGRPDEVRPEEDG